MIPVEKMSNYLAAYEVHSGAVVTVQVKDNTYKGECSIQYVRNDSRNPAEDRLVLENPLELPYGKSLQGSVSFPINEIRQIDIVEFGLFKKRNAQPDEGPPSLPNRPLVRPHNKQPEKAKKARTAELKDLEPVEIQLRTYVIRDPLQLTVLTKLLKEVDVVGICLEGQSVGRAGIVSWIIMTARKTLIPFDIDSLYEQSPDLWKTLERYIFANEKIIKVVHDGRATADYLWHVHGIKMKNVFDTQVAEALIAKEHLGNPPPQLSPLSDCLQMYNRRIPVEEMEFLRKYERMDYSSSNSPYLSKPLPPPEYLKLSAIKVKHLIPLRENMMVRLMDRYNSCVDAHLDAFKNSEIDEYFIVSKRPKEISPDLMDLLENNLGHLIV